MTHATLGVAALAHRFRCAVIGISACEPVQNLYDNGYVPNNLIERDRFEIESEMKKADAEFRHALRKRTAPRATFGCRPCRDLVPNVMSRLSKPTTRDCPNSSAQSTCWPNNCMPGPMMSRSGGPGYLRQ